MNLASVTDPDFKKRAEALEKSRREIRALQEKIKDRIAKKKDNPEKGGGKK